MPAIPSTDATSQLYTFPLSGATAAEFPVLDGEVLHDQVQTTKIHIAGTEFRNFSVQDRVVRSKRTGLLDFYYCLTNVDTVPVHIGMAFVGYSFAEADHLYLLAPITFGDFRPDGLGTVAPTKLELRPLPAQTNPVTKNWGWYVFFFDHTFLPGEGSRYFFVSTELTEFQVGPLGLFITTDDSDSNFSIEGSGTGGSVTAASPVVKNF